MRHSVMHMVQQGSCADMQAMISHMQAATKLQRAKYSSNMCKRMSNLSRVKLCDQHMHGLPSTTLQSIDNLPLEVRPRPAWPSSTACKKSRKSAELTNRFREPSAPPRLYLAGEWQQAFLPSYAPRSCCTLRSRLSSCWVGLQ